jgi:hypothetical protein
MYFPARRSLLFVVLLIVALVACAPTVSTPTPPAYWPTTGWHSAAPEEQGMDSEKLALSVLMPTRILIFSVFSKEG